MEEVYTPMDFFNLPDYLQRKIMIEDLDLDSIQNLCDAVLEEKNKNPGAVKFFVDFCGNFQFWKDKFQYDFPRSFPKVNHDGAKFGAEEDIHYWKNKYEEYKAMMPVWERDLMVAAKDGDLRRVEDLLELGADPNIQNELGITALIRASSRGYVEIAEMLLAAGANVNLREDHGISALMMTSATAGGIEIARLLLEANANVNFQENRGQTALMFASSFGSPKISEMLLKAGADVNHQNSAGTISLMKASLEGNIEIVEMLLKAGADVNHQNNNRETSLMLASANERHKVVGMLLRAGADVNAQNIYGMTALMTPLHRFRGNYDTIFEIIKAKPDPDIKNYIGETALDIAERKGLSSVVDALLYLRRQKRAL